MRNTGNRRGRVFALCMLLSITTQLSAQSPPTEQSLDACIKVILLGQQHNLQGVYFSPMDDPTRGPAESIRVDAVSYLMLNWGRIINDWAPGRGFPTTYVGPPAPELLKGQALYLAMHEMEHIECCHSVGGSQPGGAGGPLDNICDDLVADAAAYKDACSYINKRLANGPLPLSPSEITTLEAMCASMAADEQMLNSPAFKATMSLCWSGAKGQGGAPGYSPCRCTSKNYPGQADPCADCDPIPDPGSDPSKPYPNGLVIHCTACDHI